MEMITFLKDLQPTVAAQNIFTGERDTSRTFAQDLIIMGEKLGEATTGLRRSLMDNKLPTYPLVAVGLADLVIHALDVLNKFSAEWPTKVETHCIYNKSISERIAFMYMLLGDVWLHQGNDTSIYQLQRLVVMAYETAEARGFPIQRIIKEKMEFNLNREGPTAVARYGYGGDER